MTTPPLTPEPELLGSFIERMEQQSSIGELARWVYRLRDDLDAANRDRGLLEVASRKHLDLYHRECQAHNETRYRLAATLAELRADVPQE
jgi:hypothetical protein